MFWLPWVSVYQYHRPQVYQYACQHKLLLVNQAVLIWQTWPQILNCIHVHQAHPHTPYFLQYIFLHQHHFWSPQGSVLGPILFLIYINDLPDYIQNNSTVKLFANDSIIYHPITNQQDSIALQEDLDSLQRWESDWLMHFHPQKCQTMHITNKRKYLGIHIHRTLNWNTHIKKTAQRANTTSAFLHRNIRTCPRKTKHLAYTTLVRPILEYASIIWDPHTASNTHKLETVQRRSARHIMHNYNRHASVTTMLQHLDLPTLQQRRQHSKVIMLYRITHQLASIPTATYITPSTRNTQHYILPHAYMSTQRESFKGQNGGRPSEVEGGGVRGSSPGNFQKPVLQMVQSEVFLSYICEYN